MKEKKKKKVAAIIRLAVLLYLEKKTVGFPAAFARKQGTNGSSAPSGSAAAAVTPDTTLTNVPK